MWWPRRKKKIESTVGKEREYYPGDDYQGRTDQCYPFVVLLFYKLGQGVKPELSHFFSQENAQD